MIQSPAYLNKLIYKKENGKIKVITGIRRCGKSFLLTKIYKTFVYTRIPDSFKKMVIVKDDIEPRYGENGVYYVNVLDFLLNIVEL